ncbi:MAG: Na+/H+ antiporter subunit G [Immundisolibacter sp.]|uniref:Na+/H+ antiporter subunit G n=1 Tax=Immundisolibacter sp. TaxID=1934948 RepID=UPI003EE22C5A
MSTLVDYLIAGLLLTGGGFALIGSYGLARLSDFYKRLHGPTKATTLGVGCILIASSLLSLRGSALSLHELLITLFLLISAPVSAHLLVKAALHLDPRAKPPLPPEQ